MHEDERCMKWWKDESNLVYSRSKGVCGENVFEGNTVRLNCKINVKLMEKNIITGFIAY